MKKYQIIYADCPWHYRNYADQTASRWVGNQYPVMSVADLCKLPVASLAAEDCALFLWTTAPCLIEAPKVLDAWGFTYKTKAFCWVKTNSNSMGLFWGMGNMTRSNTEDCLLGVKGKPQRLNADVHQVIMSEVMGHSHKPAIAREKIVQLMGDLPRIELFAREEHEGWDCIGNDINGKDIKQELEKLISAKRIL